MHASDIERRFLFANDDAVEIAFWSSIEDSQNTEEFEAYLRAFPNGRFRVLAELRIKRLKSASPNITPSSTNKSVNQQSTIQKKAEAKTPTKSEPNDKDIPFVAGLNEDRPSVHLDVRNATKADRPGAQQDVGIYVVEAYSFGGAYKSGLLSGDVILLFNGKPVSEIRNFIALLQKLDYTSSPTLTYYMKSESTFKQIRLKVGHLLGTPEHYLRNGPSSQKAEAARFLGQFYGRRRNDPKLGNAIWTYLQQAIKAGDGEAAKILGTYFRQGFGGLPPDVERARHAFLQGEKLGNNDAAFQGAILNWQNSRTAQDRAAAFATFTRLQDIMPKAKANLALMLRDGVGTTQDLNRAVGYASSAASDGVLEANHTLSTIFSGYFANKGWPRDAIKQRTYLEKCADKVAICQVDFGRLHLSGAISNASVSTGVALLRKAALSGDRSAIQILKTRNLTVYDPFELQRNLSELGYPVGTGDGKIGRNTRLAAAQFRRDYKLSPSGDIDVRLIRDLRRVAALARRKNVVEARPLWSPPVGLVKRLREEREASETPVNSKNLFQNLTGLEELDQ